MIPSPKCIVLTGGPGGGKTAVLEIARKHLRDRVVVLPEAATIVFGGGFPRGTSAPARRAAQRAIFRVQVELETMAIEEGRAPVVLCDRGTIDGIAYWPDAPEAFWPAFGTTLQAELGRYTSVIHLRTPPADEGYDHSNRVRSESAEEAARIDERIIAAWSLHPRRLFVESEKDFMAKASHALRLIAGEIALCNRSARSPRAGVEA